MKAAAFVVGLVMPIAAVAAAVSAADDAACEPTKVQDWPICSPETINAVSSPFMAPMPHLKAETFARGFGAPLPGRARMALSGAVNGGGESCASHVAAVIGDADTLRSPLEQRKRKRLEYVRKSLAGERVPHRVVLQIYTPNIEIQQGGAALSVFSFRHGGIGGWRPNSGGNIKIYLPETSPGELVAGESYPAFAEATGGKLGRIGWFYTDWHGKSQPIYTSGPTPPPCAAANAALGKMHSDFTAEIGDTPLHGPRQIDCRVQSIAFAGEKRSVTGQLEGRVFIDSITNGNIAGHFELGGQVQLAEKNSEFTYDSKTGALTGDRLTKDAESEDGLQVTGQFNAPNYVAKRYTPGGQTVVVTGDHAPREENLLHIRSHLPRFAQRNVDWDEPGIRVKFDRPVDITSLDDDSFYLEYRDVDGRLQKVPVSYTRPGPEIVRLVPRAELKDGVRYRVQIRAGRNGVLGQRGEPLDAGYSWNFYTTVDLDDDEPMTELSDLVEPREGIEAHIFQVSRDAALVADKPTMARVYVKWATHYDVAADWQVRKFPASVRIHGDSPDGPVIGRQEKVVIQRPDEYSRDDERHAINTVNVYNLDIDSRPDTIFAEVVPTAKCNTRERQFHGKPLALDYNPLKTTLNVTYYTIPVGEWADGVPDADRALMARIAAGTARFATQNMPIRGVNMRPGGSMALSEEEQQAVLDGATDDARGQRNTLMQMLEDRMSVADARRSDIIVGFMPYSLLKMGGQTFGNGVFDDEATGETTFAFPAVAMSIKPEVARLGAIAHEFGHVFGLEHVPAIEYGSNRSFLCAGNLPSVPGVGAVAPAIANVSAEAIASIQGFRMAAGGRRGANKSVIEGNAQSTAGLVPLMFPCMGSKAPIYVGKRTTFITQRNYEKLLTNMAKYQAADLFGRRHPNGPLLLAANSASQTGGPQSGRALAEVAAAIRPSARGLLVAGHASTDGSAAIDWARHYSGTPRTPEDGGDWRLQALDADGATLAQQRFALAAESNAVFRIALDDAQDAHTIRLYRGDERIARFDRSPNAPQARITDITQPKPDRVRIAWTSQDADGDELTHQLLYAPSASGPWIALTGRDPAMTLTVDRQLLAPGPRPTLKLITSDGFNQSTTTRPIKTTAGLHVLAHGPIAGSVLKSDSDVYAIFNTDLASQSLTGDTFTLEDGAGQPVTASLRYRAFDHTAILNPDKALVPGMTYTATLAASIADRHGHTLGEPVTWQLIPQPPSPSERDAANRARTAATETGSTNSPADDTDKGKGWLELAGKRRDFEILECRQTKNDTSGYEVYVRGSGAHGLSVTARIHAWPDKLPTQQVVIHDTPKLYQLSVRETAQGWTENSGEHIEGPLINIRNGRLMVDADLEINLGGEGRKHVRIEAACPALANATDK